MTLLTAVVDGLLGGAAVLIGLYGAGPLLASLRLGPRRTSLVASGALVLGVLAGVPNELFATLEHAVHLLIISVVGLMAITLAAVRYRADTAEAAARDRERESRLVVEVIEDYAIFMLDPDGRVASWNAGAERITGYKTGEILGEHLACFCTAEDVLAGKPERQLRIAREEGRYEEEGFRVRQDGSEFFAHVHITRLSDDTQKFRGFTVVNRDMTERKQLEDRLNHQALHDELTGLPNRGLFLDRVALALARSDRHEGSPALLFVDLDRFKLVNDTLGHDAGDQLLVAVAERLKCAVRQEDTVSRFGGDEFTVLAEGFEHERDGIILAERIGQACAKPVVIDGQEVFIDASVGIVFARGADETPDSLVRDADAAMYHAKEHGRGRYQVFNSRMRPQALDPTLTESSLRQALEGDGFTVEYRPVLDLRSSTVAGVEALVRWDHPRRGRLDPEEFLPLAEETGLIHSIGAFMLDAACRQTVQWAADSPDQPALTTWLRIFTSQLLQPELPGMARATLSRTGVDPGAVCLVIDESVLADQSRSTANSLLALKGLGMRLAVAGFGAGRSSVADLRRFPLDQLTLDPSLIQGFGRRADDSALVAAMTSMAAALGLTVMAAGVETEGQLTELGALRCDLAQGPHIAGPEPADVLHEMVRGDRRLCPAGAPSRV